MVFIYKLHESRKMVEQLVILPHRRLYGAKQGRKNKKREVGGKRCIDGPLLLFGIRSLTLTFTNIQITSRLWQLSPHLFDIVWSNYVSFSLYFLRVVHKDQLKLNSRVSYPK